MTLRSSIISVATLKTDRCDQMYGLLGRKLSHSLSPQIHKHFGEYKYELFCREPYELDDFFKDKSIKAFNVTIPYKVNAFSYCDELSDIAKRIGSVNTVVRRDDGTLYGDNTDYFGFMYMAEKCGADFKGKKVVVLGSGGASLTVCLVAADLGAKEVVVISRKGENNYNSIPKHTDADIIVNTTPVGMYPNNGGCLIDLPAFKNCSCVLDLIYNPYRTQLIIDAENLGIPCDSGLTMLVAQGLRSSEQFTGTKLDTAVIDTVYEKILAQQKNIILTGMPGCGKSTLGKLLGEKLDREFVDTDEEIVKAEGTPITEIFNKCGEEYFRQLESDITSNVGKSIGKVIATGGGTVMREQNRNALRQNGTIILLKRNISDLATDGRPLSSDEAALNELYNKRKSTYEAFADYQIDVSDDAEITAERIIKCIF